MQTHLKEGQKAPDFQLPDADGTLHRLSDYEGKKLLLYFYPRDNTSGCTTEACNFSESFDDYGKFGIDILGVSTDSEASHRKFSDKFKLTFPLLADTDARVCRDYGVLKSLKPLVKTARRVTFLIAEDGRIRKIWDPVDAKTHNEQVLNLLKESED